MELHLSVFQEPRGVMRILHLVFAISAFATICGFNGDVNFTCELSTNIDYKFSYGYAFDIYEKHMFNRTCGVLHATIIGDFSSDAKFFVATGVLSMLYALGIIVVYVKLDQLYKSNTQVPLIDFVLTVIFAVLWLSSSAAWANGLSGLKHILSNDYIEWEGITATCLKCSAHSSPFSSLNISVVLGFLNFFLWASDLWFVYKETAWFQGTQGVNTDGV